MSDSVNKEQDNAAQVQNTQEASASVAFLNELFSVNARDVHSTAPAPLDDDGGGESSTTQGKEMHDGQEYRGAAAPLERGAVTHDDRTRALEKVQGNADGVKERIEEWLLVGDVEALQSFMADPENQKLIEKEYGEGADGFEQLAAEIKDDTGIGLHFSYKGYGETFAPVDVSINYHSERNGTAPSRSRSINMPLDDADKPITAVESVGAGCFGVPHSNKIDLAQAQKELAEKTVHGVLESDSKQQLEEQSAEEVPVNGAAGRVPVGLVGRPEPGLSGPAANSIRAGARSERAPVTDKDFEGLKPTQGNRPGSEALGELVKKVAIPSLGLPGMILEGALRERERANAESKPFDASIKKPTFDYYNK